MLRTSFFSVWRSGRKRGTGASEVQSVGGVESAAGGVDAVDGVSSPADGHISRTKRVQQNWVAPNQVFMSQIFKRLSAGFGKSSESAATPPASPSPRSSVESAPPAPSADSASPQQAVDAKPPAPSADSASPQQAVDAKPVFAKQSPFEFWNSDLTMQVVNEAINQHLDLDTKDPYGESALIRAVRHGDVEVAGALLTAGAQVNATDSSGETALSWAAQMGKFDVLKMLVDRPDVEMDKADKGGHTALYDACCCQFR